MTLFLINYFSFQYIYFACLRLLKIILLYIDFYHSSTTSNIYFFLFPFSESIHYQLSKIKKDDGVFHRLLVLSIVWYSWQ